MLTSDDAPNPSNLNAAVPHLSFAIPLTAWLLLLLSACLYLVEGLLKPAWVDELLQLYSDNLPSFSAVIHGQATHPFSLEPAGFHVVVHALQLIFGQNMFAERLPSFVAMLVAQLCLFWLVRTFAGQAAGLLAMMAPPLTGAFYYAVEGRTYGFIFGLSALSLLCWTAAPIYTARRRLLLVVLTLALGLIVSSHFYGVLVLVPFWLAETARTIRQRKVDMGSVAALLVSSTCVLLDLPFYQAVSAFRSTYFAQGMTWRVIPLAYITNFDIPGHITLRLVALAVGLLTLIGTVWLAGARRPDRSRDLVVLSWAFCLLPVFGYFLSIFSHAFEPRYVLPTLLGFSILAGVGMSRLLSDVRRTRMAFALLLICLVTRDGLKCYRMRDESRRVETAFYVDRDTRTKRLPPSGNLFEADMNAFLLAHYYHPGTYSDQFVLLYSLDVQADRMQYDAPSRLAANLAKAHPEFHCMSYTDFRTLPGVHKVIGIQNGTYDDWLRPQMIDDGFQFARVGGLMNGSLYTVMPPLHLSSNPVRMGIWSPKPVAPGQ